MLRRFAVICAALLVSSPVSASDEAERDAAESQLEEIALDFDEALRLAPGEADFASLAQSIEGLIEELPEDRRGAARLLAGEIRYASGEPGQAREHFEQAEKAGKDEGFRDDADFGRIRSLEAEGRDDEAWKEWKSWLRHHSKSALTAEALLAQGWNAVRRDALDDAGSITDRLVTDFPWRADDDRVVLLRATLAWRSGNSEEALALLGSRANAPALYLRALCLKDQEKILPAAAAFQELAHRFPTSPLADPARIAKADVFLGSGSWRSAAEEYGRVADAAARSDVREEALVRQAACVLLDGRVEEAIDALAAVADSAQSGSVRGRARYLRGEALFSVARHEEAVAEYNRVLSEHFDHELAASAQYRVARSLDSIDRVAEATSAYRAVVSGYPLAAESPAAAYLAGVGLLEQERPQEAAPYFQLVLDRYGREGSGGNLEFESPQHRELFEAALCLAVYSWWTAGDLGQVTGVPHLTLQKMAATGGPWRAWALLLDADALASQGRNADSREVLERLLAESPGVETIVVPAHRLLAWNHAREGNTELAMEVEDRILRDFAGLARDEDLAGARLRRAHLLFNDKKWAEAARAYDEFYARYPEHEEQLLARYQAGFCFERLGQTGDAVDRWEAILAEAPADAVAERAWVRAGAVYFQAEHFEEARRCFQGLLDNFGSTELAGRGLLRIAQCEYNAGRDAEALEVFSRVVDEHPGTIYARQAERGIEQSLYRLGQREDGGEILARLVDEHPNSPFAADAQFETARRAYDEERWEDAAAQFRRVVTQFPSYASADRAQYLMGDAYLQAGQPGEASYAWEQFLLFFPSSPLRPSAQFRLGSARFDQRNYLQAAVDFTTVLSDEVSPETERAARFNLGLCQEQLGDMDAARETFKQYQKRQEAGDPRAAEVAMRLGNTYQHANEIDKALEHYKAALSHSTDRTLSAEIHYRVGTCHEAQEKVETAIIAYRKAVDDGKSGPAVAAAAGRLAAIYDERGETSKALASYRKLAKESEDPELVAAVEARIAELEAPAN